MRLNQCFLQPSELDFPKMKRKKVLTPLLLSIVLFLMFGGIGVLSNWAACGVDPDQPFDSRMRGQAIEQMENQERELFRKANGTSSSSAVDITPAAGGAWSPLGPAPLTNGRVQGFLNAPVSGRATAVAVVPTNSNIVYLGTAQGGVWRSTNGGSSWTNIFDSALSLSIGAVAVAPSNPSIVYVGTGEPN